MAESSNDMKNKAVCVVRSDSDDEEEKCELSLLKLSLGPKKKLLILCIGGLLCHRINRKDRSSLSTRLYHTRIPDAAYGSYKVYKRPYCEEFMKFCLERFEVGIWSSAREWYLSSALDGIMVGLKGRLLFAWDQHECTDSGFYTLENKEKPLYLKELKKIWENKYSNLPLRVGQYSSSNTLLIDTDPYKALLNPPHTAVFLTDYKANQFGDNALGPKGELRLYLDGLADAEDVPSYVKEHPFGQPAITSLHPNWDFYSKIITKNSKN